MDRSYRVYGYRWAVLGAFMFVNLTIQVLWISYASVSSQAGTYFHASDLQVGLLAMLFMILFIPFSLPAAWLIDTKGFHFAVGAGAMLMGVCGIARGLAGPSYGGAVAATVGIAIAQPFLLNAWTKFPANWMAPTERATGVALITLAMLVGIGLGEALTPALVSSPGSIGTVQLVYGAVAMLSAVVFVAVAREHPRTPPCAPEMEVRALMLDGLRHAVRVRPFLVYMLVWFLGMGIFNGVLTWIDDILSPRKFSSDEAGLAGALVLLGGVVGSVTMAALSDRSRRRVRYMLIGFVLAIPGLLGMTFAPESMAWLLYVAAFEFGFFLICVGPIGMEYVAEVTQPTPEGTSQGLLQLVGQCSVAIVYLMEALKVGGTFTLPLLLSVLLLVINAALIARLKDPAATPAKGGVPPAKTQPGVLAGAG
ncbi:MAG TPA: MFS transporter [Candidatus Binatia bacterium]|nr:MFS transporter [Candidatus Binatia bacterium]